MPNSDESNRDLIQISGEVNFSDPELSAAELKRTKQLEGAKKILSYRDRVYNINPEELLKDPKKLRYWTGALFGLLEELRSQKPDNFQTLFDQVESTILEAEQKPESDADNFGSLLIDNTYARKELISFYRKNIGNDEAVKLAENISAQHPEDASVKVELGIHYTKTGKKKQGIKLLEEAVAINPGEAMAAASRLAIIYSKEGKQEEAIGLLERAVAANSEDLGIKIQLMKLYSRTHQIDKAIEFGQTLVVERPEVVAVRAELADIFRRGKRYKDIIGLCEGVIESLPDQEATKRLVDLYEQAKRKVRIMESAKALTVRGSREPLLKRNGEVLPPLGRIIPIGSKLSKLEKKVTHNPNDTNALQRLAVLNMKHNPTQAIALLERALKIDPVLPHAKRRLAGLCVDAGRVVEGLKLMQECCQEQPENLEMRYQLALLYSRARRPQQSIEVFKQLCAIDPGNQKYEMGLVKLYSNLGEGGEALKLCLEIAKRDPDNEFAQSRLISLTEEFRTLEQAITLAETAVVQFPSSRPIKTQLISLYERAGRQKEALVLMEKVAQDHPEAPNEKSRLAGAYWEMGQKDKAIATAESVVATRPRNSSSYAQLGGFYSAEGRTDDAIRILNEGLKRQPKDVNLKTELAKNHLDAGHYREARTMLEKVRQKDDMFVNYLWIKCLYGERNNEQAAARCIEYIQSPFAGQTNYNYFLPVVILYLYQINPNSPVWSALDNPEIKRRLEIPTEGSLMDWIQKTLQKRGFAEVIRELETRGWLSSSKSLFRAPYLIPVNRPARRGLTEYDFREQGTRVVIHKPKPGKVRHIDPKTGKQLPKQS